MSYINYYLLTMKTQDLRKRWLIFGAFFVFTACAFLLVSVTAVAIITLQNKQNENQQLVQPVTDSYNSMNDDQTRVLDSDLQNHAENLQIDGSVSLTSAEIEDLLYMREEEKLAHDVYVTLYEKWQQNAFLNISKSEQTHTDSIGTLIEAYRLDDPYKSGVGEFKNDDLKNLYAQLVERGSKSLSEALTVGALIEDLDIVDLEKALDRTDNSAIETVYNNLQKGSRNHLRSFTSLLANYGVKYVPQYLNQEEYESIINSPRETGAQNGGGNGGRGWRS